MIDREEVSDSLLPFKEAATAVEACLRAHGIDPTVEMVADVIGTVGWNATRWGTTRMLSPILRAYGDGLSEQRHRMLVGRATSPDTSNG